MRIFGAVVFVPTSIPTWHNMPRNDSKMKGLPRSLTQPMKLDALSGASSSMRVMPKSRSEMSETIR